MARLNDPFDSDDELPELSTIMRTLVETPKQDDGKMPPQRKETQDLAHENLVTGRLAIVSRATGVSDKPQSRKQRPLGPVKQAHVNSLLLPMSDASINDSRSEGRQSIKTEGGVSNRASPRRLAKVTADYSRLDQVSAITSIEVPHDDDCSTDLSGFIVPDSASDGEVIASRSPKNKKNEEGRTPKNVSSANPQEPAFRVPRQNQSNPRRSSGTIDIISPEEKKSTRICLDSPPSNEPFRSGFVEAHPNRLTS